MRERGLSGSVLKWIALVTMLIDHSSAAFYTVSIFSGAPLMSYKVYLFLRCVGRLAFPLYCFLLAEGYRHTRDVRLYILRLFLFGLASELPFDLALRLKLIDWSYQNVFFTLALGLTAIALWDRAFGSRAVKKSFWRLCLGLAAIGGMAALAWRCRTDYGAWGVLTIAAMYIFFESEWLRDLFSCCALLLASPLELIGAISFVPMHFYSGRRGRQFRWFFYAMYPAHLLLLWLIRVYVYGR